MYLVGDFETASLCDLKIAGAARYAQDPTTEVLSFTYRVDGGEHQLWTPDTFDPSLHQLAANPEVKFVSHSSFEQYIWMYYMVPVFRFALVPIERWIDTQASCALHAIPLDLDNALLSLDAPIVKDKVGKSVTLSLSKVDKQETRGRKHVVVNHNYGMLPPRDPQTMEKVYAYNRVDVDGTQFLLGVLGDLPDRERRVWEMDQNINQRGIRIDVRLVTAARSLVTAASEPLIKEFKDLTGLNPTQATALKDWLRDKGVDIYDVQADTIEEFLAGSDVALPGNTRRVLYLRSLLSSSSLKKLERMEACVCGDGRIRGLLQYHAASTGRWSGRLFQPQNLPRPRIKVDEDALIDGIMSREISALQKWGEPLEVLVSSLRSALVSDSLFGSGDFASVEARMVLALAGQYDKCELLASGQDVYRDMAADIYGLGKTAEVSAEQRLIGKGTVLGCGFGMGWKKFHDRYCPNQPEQFAKDAINAYRRSWAPKVPKLWAGLERAALDAMHYPGTVHGHRGIQYRLETRGTVPTLVCKLLNGKKIYYHDARTCKKAMPWDETDLRDGWMYWGVRGVRHPGRSGSDVGGGGRDTEHARGWVRVYGGHLTENVVQALARELLVDAMFRFEERGYPIVLTVHDEIVVEHPDITPQIVREIMTTPVAWAEAIGMPIAVEEWVGRRYRK